MVRFRDWPPEHRRLPEMGGVFICGFRHWTGWRGVLQASDTDPAGDIRHYPFLGIRQVDLYGAHQRAPLGAGSALRLRGRDRLPGCRRKASGAHCGVRSVDICGVLDQGRRIGCARKARRKYSLAEPESVGTGNDRRLRGFFHAVLRIRFAPAGFEQRLDSTVGNSILITIKSIAGQAHHLACLRTLPNSAT